MDEMAVQFVHGVRFLVAGAFVLSLIIALTHWAVRKGSLNAFGGWARFTRKWSDPILRPLERRVVRSGGNPQDAPLWLVGVTLVGGLVLIGLMNWLLEFIYNLFASARGGSLVVILLHYTFELLRIAIMIRVLSSWVSISPYSKFMRLIHGLTDWLVDPIRRILPPFGMLDFSPLVAYFVLYLAEELVMRGLF